MLLRTILVKTALEWQCRYGVAPRVTSAIAELDAAMLVGMSEEAYSRDMLDSGRTAVARGHDFEFRGKSYQVKANRPSGAPGSNVTLVGKPSNLEWDNLVWVLYDTNFKVVEAWLWSVEDFRAQLWAFKRLTPDHMRRGHKLALDVLKNSEAETSSGCPFMRICRRLAAEFSHGMRPMDQCQENESRSGLQNA